MFINTYQSKLNTNGANFFGKNYNQLFNSDGTLKPNVNMKEVNSLLAKQSRDVRYTHVIHTDINGNKSLQSVRKEKAIKHGVHSFNTLGDKFYFLFKEVKRNLNHA